MFVQTDRQMTVTTPLGKDVLLLVGFSGQEGLNQLFRYDLDLVSEQTDPIAFDKVLGQKITVEMQLPDGKKRHFNGIASRVAQGERDYDFMHYRIEVVPQLWLLTRRAQSRIFQHINVPDILKKVLEGLDVDWQILGTFQPRDFCVQYRETDFAFVSRLMEEEGIFYYFTHAADGHKMIVANTPQSHADLPTSPKVLYEEMTSGVREDDRIYAWAKTQELRSGKYTLWDHCFELPHKHLEADKTIVDSVSLGQTTHKLKVGNNDKLEIYDWPGGYAQRFDGVDKGGGDRAGDIQKIFDDNKRTVEIRMQAEALPSLTLEGRSNCRHFVAGHKFELADHFSDDGKYVIQTVEHRAEQAIDVRSGEEPFKYENSFTCIPAALPYRPPRLTPRPVVHGTQTAVVVGPQGEEIFTDKYGRIKVQFHWDREGQSDVESSCWVRVATQWAGKGWGIMHIPRIGQEVIVDFLEGDPDQPLVIGCVWNADAMPPYALPDEKTKSYIKSDSSKGGGGFNEIRFEDKKDNEQIFVHGQKDMDLRILKDRREWIGQDDNLIVTRDLFEEIQRDRQVTVKRDRVYNVKRDDHLDVSGKQAIKIGGSHSMEVTGQVAHKTSDKYSMEAAQTIYIKGMNVVIEGATGVCLKVGGNFVTLDPSGVAIKGTLVQINSAGAALSGQAGNLVSPLSAAAAKIADNADPGSKLPSYKSQVAAMSPAALAAAQASTHDPAAEENKDKKHWIEIELVDEQGKPVPGEKYRITCPDGSVYEGTLDEKGFARVEHLDPGTCKVTFPDLDKDAWKPK